MARVESCPTNQTEAIGAALRLDCGHDEYGNSQYLCLPKSDKTYLVEFCYEGIMVLHQKGNCLESLNGNLTLSRCFRFFSGCPKTHFRSNEFYMYPACQNIDWEHHCYLMDPSCPPKSDGNVSRSQIVYGIVGGCIALAIIISVMCFLFWKRREYNRGGFATPVTPPLDPPMGKHEQTTECALEDREYSLRRTYGLTEEETPMMLSASSLSQTSAEVPDENNACASEMFCDTAESLQREVPALDKEELQRRQNLYDLLNNEGQELIQAELRLVLERRSGKTPKEMLSDDTIKSKLKTESPEESRGILFCQTEAGKSVDVLYGLIRRSSGEQPSSGWGKPVRESDTEISDDVERLHRIYSINKGISDPVTVTKENYVRLLSILLAAVDRLDRDNDLKDTYMYKKIDDIL